MQDQVLIDTLKAALRSKTESDKLLAIVQAFRTFGILEETRYSRLMTIVANDLPSQRNDHAETLLMVEPHKQTF